MIRALTKPGWTPRLFSAIWMESRSAAVAWWLLLAVGAVVPTIVALSLGALVSELANDGEVFTGPLAILLLAFAASLTIPQLAATLSINLGSRMTSTIENRLLRSTIAPPGIGHIEDARLQASLVTAKSLSRGNGGPPLFLAVDFARGSLLQLLIGLVASVALFVYCWWAALVLALAWGSTHWFLRMSAKWRARGFSDTNLVRQAAQYNFEMATSPGFAKDIRLFGLSGWAVDKYRDLRERLHGLQFTSTRLGVAPVVGAAIVVICANASAAWGYVLLLDNGSWDAGTLTTVMQLTLGTQWIAFGSLSWTLDQASAPIESTDAYVDAVTRQSHHDDDAPPIPRGSAHIEFDNVSFEYANGSSVIEHLTIEVPPGSSIAIVGPNGSGKSSIAKLACGFLYPTSGQVRINGVPLGPSNSPAWQKRIGATFQDFAHFEQSVRVMVDPGSRSSEAGIRTALRLAGLESFEDLDIPLSRSYSNGVEPSGGQWQRLALARAICAARGGADFILMDEPTASLDSPGESLVYEELIRQSGLTSTLLISHRLSSVKHVDQIYVLKDGKIIEHGTHDQLMRLNGPYKTMYLMQAARYNSQFDEAGQRYDTI